MVTNMPFTLTTETINLLFGGGIALATFGGLLKIGAFFNKIENIERDLNEVKMDIKDLRKEFYESRKEIFNLIDTRLPKLTKAHK